MKKLIVLLLGLLGVNACYDGSNEPAPMYGPPPPPPVGLKVKGRITDEAGVPIQGIRLRPVELWRQAATPAGGKTDRRKLEFEEFVYTAKSGEYEVGSYIYREEGFFMTLQIDDVDGEQNGGKFASEFADVEITGKDLALTPGQEEDVIKETDDIKLKIFKE